MASIYRRTRSYPIPDGADFVTDRKGQRFAKWVDRKTKRTRKEPLNAAGDKVLIVESRPLSKDKRWRVREILEKHVSV